MIRLLTPFFLLATLSAVAQTTVSGTIVDSKGEPLPFASISLLTPSDSSLATGSTSDFNGAFSFKAEQGTYLAKVEFLSFKTSYIDGVVVGKKPLSLGAIQLEAGAVDLDAVEITAEQSTLELNLDKRVFNVGKDLANTGSNASEILDNVPSVTVDVEGNVSLRGSQNVRILIDGNPSGLIGTSPADALRQLQGSQIERIEVITNPSARYDAEGEVGIINIVLKKDKRKGVNGSLDLGVGWSPEHNLALNLNFRRKKFNLFTSYGLNYRRRPGGGWNNTEFTGDTTFYYESVRDHERGGLGQNFRLGSDFFLNKYNTLTISGIYSDSKGINDARVEYNDYTAERVLIQQVIRTEEEEETKHNIEANLNYQKTFKEKDRSWTTQARYYLKDDTELAELLEENSTSATDLYQRTSNREDEESFLFQTDYVDPFGYKGKWETGAKASLRTINNDYLVETRTSDADAWTTYRDFDNAFIYTENIYAGYLMAGNHVGKFSYQGGLRLEYTQLETELIKTNERNPRDFLNLFPSAHFSWEIDSTNTMQLSYSRRVSRPGFWNLIPFTGFSDSRIMWGGNPDLNPEFTHSIETGHLLKREKGSLLSSVYYRYRTDVIERIMVPDSTGFTRFFPVNLNTSQGVGFEFNLSWEPVKWFRFTGNANLYYEKLEGSYQDIVLEAETYTMTGRAMTRFKIGKLTTAQANANYQAPRTSTQGYRKSMTGVDIALSRKVFKKKGTITFSGKDIFNSRKRRAEVFGPDFYQVGEYQWRRRYFVLSFNYRLDDAGGGSEGNRGNWGG